MWQYAFASVLIVMPTIGAFGSGQGAPDRFWHRQWYFLALEVYGFCAVAVFDSFWPSKEKEQ